MGFTKIKMNSLDCQDILGNNFVAHKDELVVQNLMLLQDNSSIHKTVPISDWLSTNKS